MIWANVTKFGKISLPQQIFLVGTPMNVMTFFYKSSQLQGKKSKVIFLSLSRAAQKVVAGLMWPAGRSLPTLVLDSTEIHACCFP